MVYVVTGYIEINIIFKGEDANVIHVMDLIKFRSWSWLTVKRKGFKFSFFE